MARKTIYEPHPVSPERKAELQAQGYRIIDAKFAPAGEKVEPVAPTPEPTPEPIPEPTPEPVAEPVVEDAPAEEEPKKRGRPSKVAPEAQISDKAETSSEE